MVKGESSSALGPKQANRTCAVQEGNVLGFNLVDQRGSLHLRQKVVQFTRCPSGTDQRRKTVSIPTPGRDLAQHLRRCFLPLFGLHEHAAHAAPKLEACATRSGD